MIHLAIVLLITIKIKSWCAAAFQLPITSNNHQRQSSFSIFAVSATISTTPETTGIVTNGSKTYDSTTTAFDWVASRTAECFLQSEILRDGVGKGATAPNLATRWIDDDSAEALGQAIGNIELKKKKENFQNGLERDRAAAWLRWIKAVPSPTILDLTADLREAVSNSLTASGNSAKLESEFISRIACCRIIVLPSGAELTSPLKEPAAAILFGKLLFGGVTRYRLLPSSSRRAGEQTEIMTDSSSNNNNNHIWTMYGGPSRMYEGVDMGPAAVFEIGLLPPQLSIQDSDKNMLTNVFGGGMYMSGDFGWRPQDMFGYAKDDNDDVSYNGDNADLYYSASSLSGRQRNEAFRSDFQSTVGGLQTQIDAIVRRVLDGRVIRPAQDDNEEREGQDEVSQQLSTASLEAEELKVLGLTPVRGLLMYGPPGCGKTVLAREISRALRAREPKIVAAPELLDRWVGGSEKLVRELFVDAEAELAVCQGDASRSALHVIVIDEIDAVFRKRSSSQDNGEVTRSSVVNQILAKLDGVNAIPNVLFIGMTNRRELLDEALLRPGRLEVQIEIPLPDKLGRREILQIHFDALRQKGRLSAPLCSAIDGVRERNGFAGRDNTEAVVLSSKLAPNAENGEDGGTEVLGSNTSGRKRRLFQSLVQHIINAAQSIVRRPIYYDLADATAGYSGADIAGLVRCAGSIALSRSRKSGSGVDGLLITLEDVKQAMLELRRD